MRVRAGDQLAAFSFTCRQRLTVAGSASYTGGMHAARVSHGVDPSAADWRRRRQPKFLRRAAVIVGSVVELM